MAELELWYYIADGKNNLSSVFVSPNHSILQLKREIHRDADKTFPECNAQDLILTKVRYIMISMNSDVTNGLCWPIIPVGGRRVR
jgi:hypothetical protein